MFEKRVDERGKMLFGPRCHLWTGERDITVLASLNAIEKLKVSSKPKKPMVAYLQRETIEVMMDTFLHTTK